MVQGVVLRSIAALHSALDGQVFGGWSTSATSGRRAGSEPVRGICNRQQEQAIEYRFLGRTGLRVSTLCLGTMTFGHKTSEADSHRLLDRFVDAGGTFIDTADVYTRGVSEEIAGRWLG